MPSLAIFLHQLSATGVARNALAIGRYMSESGWRVTLITVRPGGDLAGELAGARHVSLARGGLPRGLELALNAGRLRRAINGMAPDVLLSAGNHAHLAVVAAMRGAGHRPRRVYRISNELGRPPEHGEVLRSMSLRRMGMKLVVRDADRLVLVSPSLSRDPAFATAEATAKAQVIVNGVDVARVRSMAQEPLEHPCLSGVTPMVLAVGRLSPQKNLPRLIEAFAIARRQRPMRLALVGSGPDGARRELQELATKLGVSQDLFLVGRLCNPFPFFRKAGVLVLPSLWEGSPNVLLEALACGTPVVAASSAGNAAQILDEGRYGLLVDPRDSEAMARAILSQLDPATCIAPADRADVFDRSASLAAYRALFSELVQT